MENRIKRRIIRIILRLVRVDLMSLFVEYNMLSGSDQQEMWTSFGCRE